MKFKNKYISTYVASCKHLEGYCVQVGIHSFTLKEFPSSIIPLSTQQTLFPWSLLWCVTFVLCLSNSKPQEALSAYGSVSVKILITTHSYTHTHTHTVYRCSVR